MLCVAVILVLTLQNLNATPLNSWNQIEYDVSMGVSHNAIHICVPNS